MNIVAMEYMEQNIEAKTDHCKTLIEQTESQTGRQYDWVMRPRTDSFWKKMDLKASSAEKKVYFRHDQFFLIPRHVLHHQWPFANAPVAVEEVDINEQPEPKFEYYLWRSWKLVGLKFRYFEMTALYITPRLCPPCGRGNTERPSPVTRLLNEGRSGKPQAFKRLQQCLHGIFSIACHQLRHHFKSIEPPPTQTQIDVKGIMETAGDLATLGVTASGSLARFDRLINNAGNALYDEIARAADVPQSWMPSLQRACAKQCNLLYNYTKGPWTWGCLTPRLSQSLAMKWHPPGFAEDEAGRLGECDP